MSQEDNTRDVSRRTVLKGTAITGAATGLSGSATGGYREMLQDLDVQPAMQQDSDADRTFALLGIVGGWVGIGPAEIDARTNPPLRVVEGEEYEVFWINGDDAHHNFNIRNEDGDLVESTEIVEDQGESQTVTFTAEPDLAEYFCAPHPVQMRGPIEFFDPGEVHELTVQVEREDGSPLLADVAVDGEGVSGAIAERFGRYASFSDVVARGDVEEERGVARFDTLEDGTYTVTAWTYGHETVTEEVTVEGGDEEVTISLPEIEPGEPDEVYELALREGRWCGVAPDEIAGATNPTLTVTPGETYRVSWTNAIGRKELTGEGGTTPGEPLPGHNFVVARDTGSTILRSDFLDERGQTQTVEFVAEEDLTAYLDQTQLEASGEVAVEGGDDGTGDDGGADDGAGDDGGTDDENGDDDY